MTSRTSLPQFHTWTREDLRNARLPGGSRWDGQRWVFPRETPGLANASYRIDWMTPIGSGSFLTDPAHADLLDSCRRIVWCWLASPPSKTPPKYNAIKSIHQKLFFFVRWMVSSGYNDCSCVTPEKIGQYRRFLSEWMAEGADADGKYQQNPAWDYRHDRRPKTTGGVVTYLFIVGVIHHAREALESAGLPAPAEADPFNEITAFTLAERMATAASQPVLELPDPVFAKVVNHAYSVITSDAASRTVELLNLVVERRDGELSADYDELLEEAGWREFLEVQGIGLEAGLAKGFRGYVSRLVAAAAVLIHALIAIRPSELAGLNYTSEVDHPEGCSPTELGCVTSSLTSDGMFEIFKLQGSVYKRRNVPEPAEWVLGLRPVGSHYFPPPVEAAALIAQLFHSWRIIHAKDELFVHISNSWSLTGVYSDLLREHQAHLVSEALGPDLKLDRGVTAQAWRKSFSRYMFRINAGLLPALSNHLQHFAMATTERAYIKPNPGTLDQWTNVAVEQAGTFIAEIISGELRVAGPVEQALNRLAASIRPRLSNLDEASRRSYCTEAAKRSSMSLFESHFGFCVFRTDGASCLLAHEARVTPAFGRRTPDLCRSCRNFAVAPQHRPFWERRKLQLVDAKDRTSPNEHLRYVLSRRIEACDLVLGWLNGGGDGQEEQRGIAGAC